MRVCLLVCVSLILFSCQEAGQAGAVSELFNKKISSSTEGVLFGYWEAQFRGQDEIRQVWRLKIDEDRAVFGVRCQFGNQRLSTGSDLEVEVEDQGSRYVMTFLEARDFRVSSGDLRCGASLAKEGSLFLRVDGFRMEVIPGFEDIKFEKIADLEEI